MRSPKRTARLDPTWQTLVQAAASEEALQARPGVVGHDAALAHDRAVVAEEPHRAPSQRLGRLGRDRRACPVPRPDCPLNEPPGDERVDGPDDRVDQIVLTGVHDREDDTRRQGRLSSE